MLKPQLEIPRCLCYLTQTEDTIQHRHPEKQIQNCLSTLAGTEKTLSGFRHVYSWHYEVQWLDSSPLSVLTEKGKATLGIVRLSLLHPSPCTVGSWTSLGAWEGAGHCPLYIHWETESPLKRSCDAQPLYTQVMKPCASSLTGIKSDHVFKN